MDPAAALLFAQTGQFKFLVKKTENFIGWALKRVNNPYVACSFGKDSAVMLHMALKLQPQIKVRFIKWFAETDIIDNYNEVISKWGDINLEIVEFSRQTLDDTRKDRYDTTEYDSYFIGFRQEESTDRRITLKANGKFFTNKKGLTRISPLSEWTTMDIAAYVFSNNLPVLNTYLKQGIESRTSSRIPRPDYGIRSAFLQNLKQRDISAFNQLISTFPDAKYFV